MRVVCARGWRLSGWLGAATLVVGTLSVPFQPLYAQPGAEVYGLRQQQVFGVQPGSRVALVIGNGDYFGERQDLGNAVKDAEDIARVLQALEFEVDLITNADRDAMSDAVTFFGRALNDADVGLLYYAGHGLQIDGENYLAPIDSEFEAEDVFRNKEGKKLSDILKAMNETETRLNIVILDACRNNPLPYRGGMRGLAQPNAAIGTFIAFSTAPHMVADDGRPGENSPFTGALLNALELPGLKLEDVFKHVAQDVLARTNGGQAPWTNSSITGDFYFRFGDGSEGPFLAEEEDLTPAAVATLDDARAELERVTSLVNTRISMRDSLRAAEKLAKLNPRYEHQWRELQALNENDKVALNESVDGYIAVLEQFAAFPEKYRGQALSGMRASSATSVDQAMEALIEEHQARVDGTGLQPGDVVEDVQDLLPGL